MSTQPQPHATTGLLSAEQAAQIAAWRDSLREDERARLCYHANVSDSQLRLFLNGKVHPRSRQFAAMWHALRLRVELYYPALDTAREHAEAAYKAALRQSINANIAPTHAQAN